MPGVESRSRTCSSPCRGRYGRGAEGVNDGPGWPSRPAAREPGPGIDLLDDGGLGVRVVLDVLPVLLQELPLRGLVQRPVVVVRPQPVAKADHPLELDAAFGEDVE